MTQSRHFPWTLVSAAGIAAATFIGIYGYVKGPSAPGMKPTEVAEVTTPTVALPSQKPDPSASSQVRPDTVRTVDRDHQDRPTLSREVQVAAGGNRVKSALDLGLKNSGFDTVRVLDVAVQNGVATVDLNAAAVDGLGSSGEADLIKVLKTSLSQFKGVEKLKIRVDGEEMQTLGHGEIGTGISVRD